MNASLCADMQRTVETSTSKLCSQTPAPIVDAQPLPIGVSPTSEVSKPVFDFHQTAFTTQKPEDDLTTITLSPPLTNFASPEQP
jgi:hypothetical protein